MVQCNTCKGTYARIQADGTLYFHVCPAETIKHAAFDAQSTAVTEETRTPRLNIRDERLAPGHEWLDGKPIRRDFDRNERRDVLVAVAVHPIVSEGLGCTLIE